MSEHITNGPLPAPPPAPPPGWLAERFLAPGERVVWWRGPRHGPWLEWLMDRQGLACLSGLGCFLALPFAGVFLAALLGAPPGGGFFFASLVGIVAVSLGCVPSIAANRGTWRVVTDRRSFVVKGQKLRDCAPTLPSWDRPEGTAPDKSGLFTAGPKDAPGGAFTGSEPAPAKSHIAKALGPEGLRTK
jgi:hypothetical protein